MSTAVKVAYRPMGLLVSVTAGMIAAAVFKQVWKRVAGEEDAPKPTDPDYTWREIMIAATLQGAVFAAVKALVNRSGAAGVRRLTGTWPA